MPSKTAKQHRFMLAAEHNPQIRREHHISKATAHEFVAADKAAHRFGGHRATTGNNYRTSGR